MKNNNPIGIFDSGVGGLSVLKELIKALPNEHYIYFGDTLRVPYGDKSTEELLVCTRRILDYFKTRNVKAVVVACNTCSANTINLVKDEYDFEILGLIEPASKYVCSFDIESVGLIATNATVKSNAYKNAIEANGIKVFQQSCPALVKFVESGNTRSEEVKNVLQEYLKPLFDNKIEKLILGCTHYPFLVPAMKDMGMESEFFINPAVCVSASTKEFLINNKWLNRNGTGVKEFFVSGDTNEFKKNAKLFFGEIEEVNRILFQEN